MRSARAAVSASWVARTTVMPCERAAVVSVRRTWARSARCSGAVGSSANRTVGAGASARAIETRWRSAWRSSCGRLRAWSPMSRRSSHSRAAVLARRRLVPRSIRGSAAFSQTFSSGTSTGAGSIQPKRSRRSRSRVSGPMVCTGTLLNQTSPRPGRSRPERQRSRVVLPLPRGPVTARISPSRTPSETPPSAGVPSWCWKCRARAQSTSLSGGATMRVHLVLIRFPYRVPLAGERGRGRSVTRHAKEGGGATPDSTRPGVHPSHSDGCTPGRINR